MSEGLNNSKKKGKSSKKLSPLDTISSPVHQGSSTTKSIETRRELALAVKKLNPAGVNVAPSIFWDVEGSLKNTVIDSSNVNQQVVIVENGVNYSAKRYNDLKVINDRLTFDLKNKLDSLDNEKKAFEQLDAMKNATTEEGIRLEKLEKEILGVEEDIYNKSHYARQLEFILERLKRNQLKFDAHMVGMQETMNSIEKEGGEVRLLRKGLDAGLAKAVFVLEETQNKLESARKMREVLLMQRKHELKSAIALKEWMGKREQVKNNLALQLRGELTKEEEGFLKNQLKDKVEKTKNLQKATESSHKRLQAMEDAFLRLKQVTGVSSIDEMHEKFSGQHLNKKSLEADVKEAESKLLAAKKALAKQEKFFEDVKSSGGTMADFSRDSIIKLEEEISVKKNEVKVSKAVAERLTTVMLGLNQGARGLLQRTSPYTYLVEGDDAFENVNADEDIPWAETLDSLSSSEQILAKMVEHLNGETQTGTSSASVNEKVEDDDLMKDLGDFPPAQNNNIRIKSKKIIKEIETGFAGVDAISKEEIHEEVKANGSAMDNNEDLSGNDNNKSSMGNIFNIDDAIPSRLAVKKDAQNTMLVIKRKEEQESRIKRLAESKGNGNDDLALEARLKAQKQSGDRLCTVHHPPTLPEGVTLRDDVMTKAKAFIVKMPDLI